MLGLRAISEGPISALLDALQTVTTEHTVRFATQSFVTRSADSPAHEFIEGRITRGLTLGRKLGTVEAGQWGALFDDSGARFSPNYGEIELLNLDGALDSLATHYFADGRQVRLKIGATEVDSNGRERVKPYSTFALVYTAFAGEWTFEHDVVKLRLRSLSDRLKDRLQLQTYAGTGGKNGTSDMTGRTVPTLFGRCNNVTCQLVDPSILTYQVHWRRIDSVVNVYDAGISVPVDADYATYALLAAATVPAGSYATCLAEGFIRLGVVPVGAVTADVRGDNSTTTGYPDEHAGVIKRILLDYAGFTEAEFNLHSFTALDAIQPHSMGIFFPAGDTSTSEEAIEQVAFSCGAFAGQDRSGLFRVKRLDAPKATQDWSFDDRDIIAIERESLPYVVPWKAWGVQYFLNWTVQTSGEIAAGVTQARRQFLESTGRFVYAQSPAIALAHRTSAGAPLRRSLFGDKQAAQDEADRLISLYSLDRALYRVRVKNALFSVEIGQTVRLTYDRWDLGGGQNFVAVGIEDDADSVETEMLLFGAGDTANYDYDIEEALYARENNDEEYFTATLPTAQANEGIVSGAPDPPSLRSWTETAYPALDSADIGLQAKNVLIEPDYPVAASGADGPWHDPNPSTNQVACYIGAAPDASTAIEVRFLGGSPSQSPQFVEAYIPLVAGVTQIGVKLEVWNETGFDWGDPGAGGKIAGGMWGGGTNAQALVTPWGTQDGVTMRNIWANLAGSPSSLIGRGYAYVLNRFEPAGIRTASIDGVWTTGAWQTIEYEGVMNDPGRANGIGRMWIDGVCVAEITNAVWTLAGEWLWRGITFSDDWQDSPVNQNQKRWIRNLTVYTP